MTTNVKNTQYTKSKGARFFDRFVLAGLIMNVIVVLTLVGVWFYKSIIL